MECQAITAYNVRPLVWTDPPPRLYLFFAQLYTACAQARAG